MDMGEQRLDAGDQRLAVEQFADGNRRFKRRRIALTPGARAQVGIEVGGGRNAAGEGASPRVHQRRLGRGEHREVARDRRRGAGIGHVAGGILQPDDAARECFQEPLDQRRRARAGPTSPGSDRDRAGSAWRRSPAPRHRYRQRARRRARPCNRTAASTSAPAKPSSAAWLVSATASAIPRRRRCRPSAGSRASRSPCTRPSRPCARRARTRSLHRWCPAR